MKYDLSTPEQLAAELGRTLRIARAAQALRQEDLAVTSGASLQAIKNLEAGGRVDLLTFLRVAHALKLSSAVMEACEPIPRSLDEIERMEAARSRTSRVRVLRQ